MLAAQIPIPAVRYAFVYPPSDVAQLEPDDCEKVKLMAGSNLADALLHGGFAYVDQSGYAPRQEHSAF